jgi:type I restriction enzyme R subunit
MCKIQEGVGQAAASGGATQSGLGNLTKSVTFDLKTLEALRGEKGPDEGKVFNLVRGLQKEIDDDPNAAPVLQPLKDRAERILKDMEDRKTTGLAAVDLLAALAAEKDAAAKAAKETGLSAKAFGIYWALKDDAALKQMGVTVLDLAKEVEKLMGRFPNSAVNADEQRQLRAALYRPLLGVEREARSKIVELIIEIIVQ